MASGIGLSLDTSFLQSLDEVDKKIKELSKGTDAISKRTIAAFQQMAKSGVLPYIEQLERQKKALEEIEKAAGKGTIMSSLKNEAKAAVDEINKVIDALRKTKAYRDEQSGRDAISFSNSVLRGRGGEAKSINNLQLALSQLEEAQGRINLKTKKGRQDYLKIGEAIKQVKKELEGVVNTTGGFQSAISTIFSLNAIRNFASRLKDIRGEFEMQHRSLQVLLQDIDEANELWDKTVNLAVKSPYRVKELVTYTKQLAAYRIETEKLYDTTRMLADVSSGLGVDMNRLILAFGQVKAANFLRGTELRQFSEAGVNLLKELSKRFTQLEGRVVSVGDVFDRVSKRMVSFADVEAVFQTITSEGGVFYQMQEKQSETLKGIVMNLKDSVDLMFNDIGAKNDGIIKGALQSIKALVDNWSLVSSVGLPVLATLLARWKLFSIITNDNGKGLASFSKLFVSDFKVVITHLMKGKKAAEGMAIAGRALSTSWLGAISVVIAALAALIGAIRNTTKTARELEKIELSGAFDASQAEAEYKRLADVVRDSSKSYDEQQKALSILQKKYGEILPAHLLEAKTIKAIGGNYEEATVAIREYIAAKTKEKQIDLIGTEYGEKVETQASDLARNIKNALAKVAPQIKKSDVLPIVNRLRELIEAGDVDAMNIDAAIQRLVREFTGLEISTNAWKYTMMTTDGEMVTWNDNAQALVRAIKNMNEALDEASSSSLDFQDSFVYRDFNKIKDGYEEQSQAIGKYYETIRKYQEQQEQGVKADEIAINKEAYEGAIRELNSIFIEAQQEAPKWNEIINEPFKLNEATMSANKILWKNMIDEINNLPILPAQNAAKEGFVERLEKEMEGFEGGQKQKEISRIAQGLADTMNVSLKGLDELFLGSEESLSDYAKRVGEILEQYKQRLKMFDNDVKNNTYLSDLVPEDADLFRAQIPFLEKYLEYYKALLTPKKTTPEDTFTPMLRSVKEIYEEFKKLSETFDEVTAKEGAIAKFGDVFKDAFGKTPEEMGFDLFSQEGVEKAYDYLISKAPDAKKKMQAKLAKGEIVWDVKLKTREEENQKLLDHIQNMFDQYDLSLELKKLNIAPDVAKSLFGIESIGLEDIRKKVEDELASAKEAGGNEDRIKQLEKDLEKINDMEDKAQIERLQKYLKYTREAIGERAQIKIEEMNKLQEIEETFDKAISKAKTEEDKKRIEEQRKLAQEGVKRESSEKTKKLDWEDFKSSDTFINLFNDIDNASSDLINHTITQIQKFKDEWTDMPVESAKEMAQKLNDLQLALMDTDRPLKDNKKLWAELGEEMEKRGIEGRPRNAKAQAQLTEEVTSENKEYEKEVALGKERITILETINNLTSENKAQKLEELGITEDSINALGLSKEVLTNTVKANNDIIKGEKTQIKNTNDKIEANRKILNTQKKISQNAQELNEGIDTAKTLSNDLYGAFKDLYKALGGDDDGPVAVFADMGMSMANTVLDTIMLIVQMNAATIAAEGLGAAMKSATGIIGWIVMGIELLVQAITAAVSYAEKLRQMKLDVLAGQVDNLKQKFDALSDSIDKAWSIKELQKYEEEIDKVRDKMKKAQEDYIKLLEGGKDKDVIGLAKDAQAKIDQGFDINSLTNKERKALLSEEYQDYKDATDALLEMEKDYEEQKQEILESVGGITDPHDAASEFVDAWLDAYKETGDGLKGLEENFDEFFVNLIKQKAARMLSDTLLTKWIDTINGALSEDSEGGRDLTNTEMADIKAAQEKAKGDINELLKGLFTGLDIGTQEGGSLSALQKGIQGLSEKTGQIIEAYLNSIRGYVSEQVTHTKNIYNILYDATRTESRAIWVKLAGQ